MEGYEINEVNEKSMAPAKHQPYFVYFVYFVPLESENMNLLELALAAVDEDLLELDRHVGALARHHGWTEGEIEEATVAGREDLANALPCLRQLAREISRTAPVAVVPAPVSIETGQQRREAADAGKLSEVAFWKLFKARREEERLTIKAGSLKPWRFR
jgi:hypothetical protein